MEVRFEEEDRKVGEETAEPSAGWVQQFDDAGQPYFYELRTGESRWEEPPLGEGGYWKQLWDDHHDALFYQHTVSGEMRWEFPSLVDPGRKHGSPAAVDPEPRAGSGETDSAAERVSLYDASDSKSDSDSDGRKGEEEKSSTNVSIASSSSVSSDSSDSDSSDSSSNSADDDTVFYVYHCVFLAQGCLFESPAAGIESVFKLVYRILVTVFYVLLAALQCFNDAALQKIRIHAVECGILLASAVSLFSCIPGALVYRDFNSFEDTFQLMPLYTLIGRVDPRRFWVFTHFQGSEATNVLSGSYPADSMDDFKTHTPRRKYNRVKSKGPGGKGGGKKKRKKKKGGSKNKSVKFSGIERISDEDHFEMTRI
jgi:hypothetical protein